MTTPVRRRRRKRRRLGREQEGGRRCWARRGRGGSEARWRQWGQQPTKPTRTTLTPPPRRSPRHRTDRRCGIINLLRSPSNMRPHVPHLRARERENLHWKSWLSSTPHSHFCPRAEVPCLTRTVMRTPLQQHNDSRRGGSARERKHETSHTVAALSGSGDSLHVSFRRYG